ncbi:SDR family oxidoreductase [Actinomyces sp. B33]|uniref:SDR family oxidoreductase n=1 Tax=Actinomyces sp. B33 TaxID=2942131 RepID=UPI002341A9A9|nr:SDR family oxidoreductase [Actinomyces sp. B33]MDC4233151.1 SDR family oxidoreductase [Actinomyces sp. B33]
MSETRRAVVTGASTGIGEATVEGLRALGWEVVAVARREDRLKALAERTGCDYRACDLRDAEAVEEMTRSILADGPVDALVNNAGGAIGVDQVAEADPAVWSAMYERNVLTALNCTRALLPGMRERGGDLVFLTSTAGHDTYPGGGGYVAAKHAERIIANTLRQELVGEPVRIIEIAPGMVKTPEFSLNRLGSQEAADKVYEGVAEPLVARDVADAIIWTLTRPRHVNIDSMIVRPVAQATNTLVARED